VVSRNPTLRPAGISRPDSEIDEASNGKAPLLTKRGFSEKVILYKGHLKNLQCSRTMKRNTLIIIGPAPGFHREAGVFRCALK